MPSGYAIVSYCSPAAEFAVRVRSKSCARAPLLLRLDWRMSSLRSPEEATVPAASIRPLLVKELRGVIAGRALWTMLLILCPFIGYSFFQAVALYGEASAAARDAPALASGLSPLDGVLVPTFGAFYLAVTLLFPFVAIRALGREKETGSLRLLVQLPYGVPTLIGAKMVAIATAWLISFVPAITAF